MSRAIWVLAVLFSHWRRHPMQLATLLVGLMSATALWSGVQALNQQARDCYDRAAAAFGGARTAMLVGARRRTFPQALFVDLRRAGWPVSPVLEGRVRIERTGSSGCSGIEPITLPATSATRRRSEEPACRSSSRRRDETLVAPETLADLGLPAGAARRDQQRRDAAAAARAGRNWCPACWWSISASRSGCSTCRISSPASCSARPRAARAPLESVVGDRLRLVAAG